MSTLPPPTGAPYLGPTPPVPPTPGVSPTPDTSATYSCIYCRMTSTLHGDLTCPRCGAPVDLARQVSDTGWIVLPGAKDLARIQFAHSTAQISGSAVPVCDVSLAAGESLMFYHTELLWTSGLPLASAKSPASLGSRLMGGLPRTMLYATGPGNLALSADGPGELIAVPLEQNQSIVVAQHHILAFTPGVDLSTIDTGTYISEDQDNTTGDVLNRYVNAITATAGPALVILHAPGNVVVRDLGPSETLHVQPTALVYTDYSVARSLSVAGGARSGLGYTGALYITQLTGPGRIALASVYERVPRLPGNTSLRYNYGSNPMGLNVNMGSLGGSLLKGILGQ